MSPPQLPNPGREPEGSAPPREGARAAGTKAIGPEPPAPPRHHLVGICGGGSWHPPWGSGPAPPRPTPAYLLRPLPALAFPAGRQVRVL